MAFLRVEIFVDAAICFGLFENSKSCTRNTSFIECFLKRRYKDTECICFTTMNGANALIIRKVPCLVLLAI